MLKKGLLWAFASSVSLGLALAGLYVGARISSGVETRDHVAIQIAAPSPAPVLQPPAPAPARPVELYLEVAALGGQQDTKYLRQLIARGFPARIESSASDQPDRILIGPYEDRPSLEHAQRKLEARGILALESAH